MSSKSLKGMNSNNWNKETKELSKAQPLSTPPSSLGEGDRGGEASDKCSCAQSQTTPPSPPGEGGRGGEALLTFFSLYLARAIPATFIMTALQVTLRQQHISLAAIGLLSLVRLPWSLKFLWAPLIDRHCVTMADFRRVVVVTETVFALAIFTVGFLDVATDLTLIVSLVALSTFAASVQNVTNDTLAVRAFGHGRHSAAASMKSAGRYVGRILGGGLLIMLLHDYGWGVVVPCLGFFALLLMLPLVLNRHIEVKPRPANKPRATLRDFARFFTRREALPHLGFLLLFFAGFDGIMAMLKPWMVDMGYDMKEIGLYNGVVGTSAAFVMAVFAGWWVKRTGTKRARRIVATVALAVPLFFLALTFTSPTLPLVLGGIVLLRSVEASAAVTLYATAMDRARPGCEATDFTVQIVLVHLSGALTGAIAGGIGEWLDYRGLCLIELVLALGCLGYVFFPWKKARA